MRPARKGPENPARARGASPHSRCFNEAGPQGAGKPDQPYRVAGNESLLQ